MNWKLLPIIAVTALPSGSMRPVIGRPVNVLIVTLDTTRADRLPAYGFMSASMPALDRLANDGVVFLHATSVAPLTLPAHCSLFTGRYPPRHGVRDNGDAAMRPTLPTLAEMLRARGLRTAAFVGSKVLAADRGLARGFEVYRDGGVAVKGGGPTLRRPGNQVVDEALAWLAGHGASPFFLWVHLYDAHAPYHPPEPYRSRYPSDPYEGGIAFADAQLGRLIDALDARHVLEATAVVVVADHGESLGEHEEAQHGIFVYESVLHVPLIVRAPAIAPRRVPALASLVDVMPTVLDLLGMTAPPVDGTSLVPLMRGAAPRLNRALYAESRYPERFGWSPLRALRDARFKFIDAPTPELYDLEADPFEEHNLYANQPALATTMARALAAVGDSGEAEPAGRHPDGPQDVRDRLTALGYVGGGRSADAPSKRDPKDYIRAYNARHLERKE